MPSPKLCAGCQTRPRRYACLRCGDALCRRCTAHRACGCYVRVEAPPYERDVKPPDIFEQLCALPQTSSVVPPPASRAAETPAPSTPPRDCPPEAGSGRASTSLPLTTIASVALELAAQGPFHAGQLADRTRKSVESCRTVLWHLQKRGLLTYTPPPEGPGRGRSGKYAAAVPGERAPATSLVTTAASSVALHARARGPVAGQHARPADFFADKPALPSARPPVVPERGARHAR
jgi:hypothetical protein